MPRNRITLFEVMVIIVAGMIVVVVVLIVPAIRNAGAPNLMKNGTQMSKIVRSLVLYANSHNDRFPKLGIGSTIDNTATARFQELITFGPDPIDPTHLLDPENLINPIDKGKQRYSGQGPFTTANFSYTLLVASSPEWRNTQNGYAPLASDRLVGTGSLWDKSRWFGDVAWGDGHVSSEIRTTHTEMWDVAPPPGSTTQAASGSATQPARTIRPNDDIFSAADGGAMMEYN